MPPRILFVILGLLFAGAAGAADSGWVIDRNDIEIEIHQNGDLLVKETIVADFQVRKRGIIRLIPIRYDVGMHQYSLDFKLLDVTDDQGTDHTIKKTTRGNAVSIRIGDADRFLTGRHVYRIRYRVRRAVLWEEGRAILRWNAVGTEWEVPTRAASVRITVPPGLGSAEVVHDAWTGVWGDRGRDFTASTAPDGDIMYELGSLRRREGVTVEVGLPESAVPQPGVLMRLLPWLLSNVVYLLWPATALICYLRWRSRGRDLPGLGSITVQYGPPQDLSPAEVGTLSDEQVNGRDISATIVDLAVRGFLTIEQGSGKGLLAKDEYTFRKLDNGLQMRPHEKMIIEELFDSGKTARMEDLTGFYRTVPRIRKSLFEKLTEAGHFDGHPHKVRSRFLGRALPLVLLVFVGVVLLQLFSLGRIFWVPLLISTVLSLITVVVTSFFMPRRTSKGRRTWELIAGLEEYIRRAEAGPLADSEKRGRFEELLPYAMIFGLTDRWARAFEGIYDAPPNWYQGEDGNTPSTVWLAHALGNTTNSMQSQLYTPPRSSSSSSGSGWSSGGFSGGSSGGGFGGGGGSSW